MQVSPRNELGWIKLDEPGDTPADELWRSLLRLHGIAGWVVEACDEAKTAYITTGRPPKPMEFPESRPAQHSADRHGAGTTTTNNQVIASAWTDAIESLRGVAPLWHNTLGRAKKALPHVACDLDDSAPPAQDRFTGRVGQMLARLSAALPYWTPHKRDVHGDQYARRANNLHTPDWVVEAASQLLEPIRILEGTKDMLGHTAVQEFPDPIRRVISRVRASPAEFKHAIQRLESAYTDVQIHTWVRETLAAEIDIKGGSEIQKMHARMLSSHGVTELELRADGWERGRARHRLSEHLMRSWADPKLRETVPLRIAYEHEAESSWRPDEQVRADRKSRAQRIAVLSVLLFDPDAADYLRALSKWAGLGWASAADELNPAKWGRLLAHHDCRDVQSWARRCERALDELGEAKPDQAKTANPASEALLRVATPEEADRLTPRERDALEAELAARRVLGDSDASLPLKRVFQEIVKLDQFGYDSNQYEAWSKARIRARQRLGLRNSRLIRVAPASAIDRRSDRSTTAP